MVPIMIPGFLPGIGPIVLSGGVLGDLLLTFTTTHVGLVTTHIITSVILHAYYMRMRYTGPIAVLRW